MTKLAVALIVALGSILLLLLAKKGWIELPKNPYAFQGMSLTVGAGIMVLAISSYYAGWEGTLVCWGPVVFVGLLGFALGFSYYKKRQESDSDVQKLNLDDR